MIHLIYIILSLCGMVAGGWYVAIEPNRLKDIAGYAFGALWAIFGAFQIGGFVEWIKLMNG